VAGAVRAMPDTVDGRPPQPVPDSIAITLEALLGEA
jgi:hypothetical protein